MADCPTCEYHKKRAQIWRDEAYRLAGHPLPRKEKSMTHEEQIAKLTEMLEIQQKLHETAIDMLKPAVDAAYQKGYADAMGWKTQNHLEHLPQRTWVGLTEDEAIELLPVGDWEIEPTLEFAKAIEAKLKEKNG
jgi:hypothetical protein